MADTERKEQFNVPEGVTYRPEEFELSEDLKKIERKEGIQTTKSQFAPQVTDDHGRPLTESPLTKVVSIEIPGNQEILEDYSKGSTEEAKTWWSRVFMRLIKKALHFGWKIIGKNPSV